MSLLDTAECNGEKVIVWKVIIDRKEQYSILPAHLPSPSGWSDADKNGIKEECLAYIREEEQREDL